MDNGNAREVAVTLPAKLFKRLRAEARQLGVPIEWLVATLVVETFEDEALRPVLA